MFAKVDLKASKLLFPFIAFWELCSFLHEEEGQFIAGIMGMVMLNIGIVVTIGSIPVGIFLIIYGFFILVRAIF